jgi:heterodisulfide reductase subunit A-like polyferredoxin
MVVGGGIAGMQASLDLADQGFKVYLVEAQSAIGGHMAQLDKTFPTNDCAMCTISPRLVETGRHPNITLLTDSEVLDVQGHAGDFTVKVRRQPRYIDVEKCVGCGDCAKVCPVIISDTFNEGLAKRRAAYKLYPQAVPNAYAIAKRGIAPCRDACPAGQRAQGYIALIREGRWYDALRVIKMDNPFPGICGRICNHRCESACNRGQVDEPINIRALKRFVTDKVYAEPRSPVEPAVRRFHQRIAIIGAGPCGLTAAQDLVREGYGVTVFEAMPVAGGMLRLGVPEYRLPADIIEREVQDIVDLGVDLRLNHRIDNLDDIFNEGFDAVLISVGAHEGIRLPIPGANLDGVVINTHFLRDVRLGRYNGSLVDGNLVNSPTTNVLPLGQNVLVLGGGNVAIDCARSAVRLGRHVEMACLESGEKVPAHPWEVQAAREEGILLHEGRTFERILGDEHGRVRGVECMRVASFSFDEMGRLNVEKAPDSTHVIACDTVIFSVGQRAGLAFIPDDAGVGLTGRQLIAVNPNTLAATREGVFAAGDSVSGTAFVIEAVNSGHTAARSISRYLQGEHLEPPPRPELPIVKLTRDEIAARLARGEIKRQRRVPLPELPVAQRIDNFSEVEGGYDDQSAQQEAARCLACGICSECMSCTFACGVKAIDHNMVAREDSVRVGAVVLAPGYQAYRAELSEEYGLGRYPNVVTSLQFERLLSASGPTAGHVVRPADGQRARRIAFLQCVGSRDQTHDYCSAVCCMYATKEAIIAKEHQRDLDVHVFMMDLRAFSKGYEEYYRRARQKYGVQYTRCRISSLREDPITHNLIVRYLPERLEIRDYATQGQSISNLQAPISLEEFDLVVLSVGMEISPQVRELGRRLGVELDDYGFCHTPQFNPLETSRAGIYAVGPFRGPKDIPESIVEASGAAAAAATRLSEARFTLTTRTDYPPEHDITAEEPRVGVFVCHCGSNIGGFLDVPNVAEYARTLPNVVHAENNLYTCAQDSIKHIAEQIKELRLNRVVVASCTPLTHQPLFQDCLRSAGLNPYLFEMANIRNQCSWVHSQDRAAATSKAQDLVRMAAARAALLQPQHTIDVPVKRAALIVGGGAAGMSAALSLAEQGFPVHLIEKEAKLGGNLRWVSSPRPPSPESCKDSRDGAAAAPLLLKHALAFQKRGAGDEARDPQTVLTQLIERVTDNPLITVHLESRVVATSGFMGNFVSKIQGAEGKRDDIEHGVTILATGAQEYRGPEYGFGTHPNIITQQQFEKLLVSKCHSQAPSAEESPLQISSAAGQSRDSSLPAKRVAQNDTARAESLAIPNSVVMIQCVGPAEKYCSRICCIEALKNALALKEQHPDAQVVILYKDIRTYGFQERLYTTARERGVVFIRYDDEHKPAISVVSTEVKHPERNEGQSKDAHFSTLIRSAQSACRSAINNPQSAIEIQAWDSALRRSITLQPDLLVLSMPVVPRDEAREVAKLFKVPLDADGFFLEAHVKLRPVDFASDGVFMAGLAHYPKLLDETLIQAQAAASRAARVLSREALLAGGRVAVVDDSKCTGCLTCVRICPFGVPKIKANLTGVGNIMGAAYIEAAVCQGCGSCVAECPAQAIQLMHYTDAQMVAKVQALLKPRVGFVPVSEIEVT